VANLDEVIPVNGVVIHSQSDWPCSGCRPSANDGQSGTFLCVKCAISLTSASIRGIAARAAATEPPKRESEISEAEEDSDVLGWVPPALWGQS
jgi:hypothetical protein